MFPLTRIASLLAVAAVAAVLPARAADTRVFEIRTYTTLEGKLPDLLKRFRDHTVKLFEKHGMVNIAYWVPQDEPRSKNTLIYVLAHRSRGLRDRDHLRVCGGILEQLGLIVGAR